MAQHFFDTTSGGSHTDARKSKEYFEAFMARAGFTPVNTPVEDFLKLVPRREEAMEVLAVLEPALTSIAKDWGYRYVEPFVSDAGVELLLTRPLAFVKCYGIEMRRISRDCVGDNILI